MSLHFLLIQCKVGTKSILTRYFDSKLSYAIINNCWQILRLTLSLQKVSQNYGNTNITTLISHK